MDFEDRLTNDQERFRDEVHAWLTEHLPQALRASDSSNSNTEGQAQLAALRRKLGERGWLVPALAPEQGGLGLAPDLARVLRSELDGFGLRWLAQDGAPVLSWALANLGTQEQVGKYLQALAAGWAIVWRPALEPGASLDVGAIGVEAIRDGDDFVLDGEATFVGHSSRPDYLWTLAVVDRNAPPKAATATFLVSPSLEGITIRVPRTLNPETVRHVTFDQVRVPAFELLGEEGAGWSLLQAAQQADPWPKAKTTADQVEQLLQYARETERDGAPLSEDEVTQQLLVDAFLKSWVTRLLSTRNEWMTQSGQQITYEEAQVLLLEKRASLNLARIVRDVMGAYALLDENDARALAGGEFERQQRQSLADQNPTGGPEVYASAMARHLGLAAGQPGDERDRE